MKRIAFTDGQFKIVVQSLEVFIQREQTLADEQGIPATADQEIAEDLLDLIEQQRSPHDA